MEFFQPFNTFRFVLYLLTLLLGFVADDSDPLPSHWDKASELTGLSFFTFRTKQQRLLFSGSGCVLMIYDNGSEDVLYIDFYILFCIQDCQNK